MSLTVVQTLPALDSGGVERGTVEVARELVRRGHRSIVVSEGGRLLKSLKQAGSEHIELPVGRKNPLTLRHVSSLRSILVESRADIIHARSRLPAWVSWLAWQGMKKTKPRFITTVHGPYTVNAYSRIMTRGEQVIAISDFIREYIVSNYPGCGPDRITIIPRGVSPEEFPYRYQPEDNWLRDWKKEFSFLEDKFVVTLPARITRWKGQEDFVEILAELLKRDIPVHGLIAGGAEMKKQAFLKELQNKVRALGLSDHISFLGHRSDLREVMAVSNMVLSLAREPEAFGRTALEALRLGIPVVAYDHGGAKEVLQAIFPQGLTPPMEIQAAVDKIQSLYDKPIAVPQKDVFSLESMLDATISLYERAARL